MISLKIKIEATSDQWKNVFPSYKKKIQEAAACAFLLAKKPAAFKDRDFEINIVLTTDANIKKLNKSYRGKDAATNVLSFPQINLCAPLKKSDLAVFPETASIPLGDIVVAYQTTKKETKEESKTMEEHVLHLIVHGTLHLLGQDHMKDADASKMEKLEAKVLDTLGYENPYK